MGVNLPLFSVPIFSLLAVEKSFAPQVALGKRPTPQTVFFGAQLS